MDDASHVQFVNVAQIIFKHVREEGEPDYRAESAPYTLSPRKPNTPGHWDQSQECQTLGNTYSYSFVGSHHGNVI